MWQASGSLAETPDLALLGRLREVLGNKPVTETELRTLTEQVDGLVRTLGAHIAGSEERLAELTEDPDSSLTDIATELQRVEALRPRLEEARSLLADLETRARELRTSWLLRTAEDPLSR
jgi:chromosome segregation ATPase